MSNKEDRFFFGTDKENMDVEEYIKRINTITEYYYESSNKYKRNFYLCCFVRFFSSALIPIVSLASEINWSTVVVSVLAGVITVTEGYVNVSRAYEKWTKYREKCNALWIEQRYFAMNVGIYADGNSRVEKFVDRCEKLMLEETNEWKKYIERAKEMK